MEQSYCRGVEWKLEIERWSGDWNRDIVEGWGGVEIGIELLQRVGIEVGIEVRIEGGDWNRGWNRGGKAIVGVEQRVEIGTVARTVIGGATSSLKA